jgi:Outer membrane protein beta-barrel domain
LKHTYLHLPIFVLVFGVTGLHAQSSLDVHMGVSGANAKSNGLTVDTFGDGNLYTSPALDGVFMNFGAGVMMNSRFGFGGQFSFKPAKSDYAGLNYRPLFYDFNGIFNPAPDHKRVRPEIQAGIGGVNLRFYYPQSSCNVFAGCVSSNTYLQSSNHFQLHAGAGVALFVTDHIYVEPKFDLHYVNNFYQFGTNWVPQYGINFGYRFGE